MKVKEKIIPFGQALNNQCIKTVDYLLPSGIRVNEKLPTSRLVGEKFDE